jgi:hypothetical protein
MDLAVGWICRTCVGGFNVEALVRWSLVEPWVENPRVIF